MTVQQGNLAGLLLLEMRSFPDERGSFQELYRGTWQELGVRPLVQFNTSRSVQHVVRGLHFQVVHPQAKLVSVLRGKIWDVAVDLRRDSPTFGQHQAATLSDENHVQMYIPEGFAHGFCVLSDVADVLYGCSDYYSPGNEVGLAWNDPALGIAWPATAPIVSAKDQANPLLSELDLARLR